MNIEKSKTDFRRKQRKTIFRMIMIMIIFIMLGVVISIPFNFNDHEYTVIVTDKERIVKGSGESTDSKYLVFVDDVNGESRVFENTDTLLRLKWNSSNIQGKLKVGHTYKITVVGFRMSFMSMYENIIKVEEVK